MSFAKYRNHQPTERTQRRPKLPVLFYDIPLGETLLVRGIPYSCDRNGTIRREATKREALEVRRESNAAWMATLAKRRDSKLCEPFAAEVT